MTMRTPANCFFLISDVKMACRERLSSESSSESVNLEDLEKEEKGTPIVKGTFNVTFK
jgi:hypothetical protein